MDELTPEDAELIERIRQRVISKPPRFPWMKVYPPATPEQIRDAEQQIDFRLPPLIREIYLRVGNGGFGPGYGIIGVDDGCPIYDETLAKSVLMGRAMAAELLRVFDEVDPGWMWNEQFIMYGYWGCNVTTVVDCQYPCLPVYTIDSLDVKPNSAGTLHQWWKNWLDGVAQQY